MHTSLLFDRSQATRQAASELGSQLTARLATCGCRTNQSAQKRDRGTTKPWVCRARRPNGRISETKRWIDLVLLTYCCGGALSITRAIVLLAQFVTALELPVLVEASAWHPVVNSSDSLALQTCHATPKVTLGFHWQPFVIPARCFHYHPMLSVLKRSLREL